tara:strand:- start:587 stop:2290 length:1704 start_codon:yes stop_codon:yes gene_type:complete
MKYGDVSHGTVDVDQPSTVKISDGDVASVPNPPKTGDIRYNHEREVTGLDGNSGKGQYEIYRNGNWTTLLTEMDMTSDVDVKQKTKVSDNVIFKMIADSLKDTFISAIGNISLIQENDTAIQSRGRTSGNTATFWPGNQYQYGGTTPQENLETNDGTRVLPTYMEDVQWTGDNDCTHTWSYLPGNVYTIEDRSTGNNLVGTFKSYIGNGKLYDVLVDDGGEGYDPQNPPQLLLDTRGGRGAIITAEVVSGVLTRINVIESGSGYRADKLKVIEKGARARVYARYQINTQDDGNGTGTVKITDIEVLNGGDGYETLPEVFISDGGHSAIIEPVMGTQSSSDKIVDVIVKASGFDYEVTPDVVIKSTKEPTRVASLTCQIGNKKLLNIKLMKPIPSNFLSNGQVPLTITGGDPITTATAYMKVENGVGAEVVITDSGSGYESPPEVSLPATFDSPTTGVSVFAQGNPNHQLEFTFDIFQACGVNSTDKHLYNISLLNNLSGTFPLLSPYSGQLVKMMAEFEPTWAPFTNFNHANYGIYNCTIQLFGQKFYYSSAVTASWFAQVTKSRNT